MPALEQLLEKQNTATVEMETHRRKWKKTGKPGTKDEFEAFDKASAEYDAAREGIEEFEGTERRMNLASANAARLEESKGRQVKDDVRGSDAKTETTKAPTDNDLCRSGTDKWLRADVGSMTVDEHRALKQSAGPAGGFLSMDEQFVSTLIQAVDNQVFIRGLATVHSLPNADSLGAPSLENDIADPTWTTELSTGTADTTLDFGRRSLTPHPLAQKIRVSNTLLRKAALGAEAIVRQRLAYKIGVVQENAHLTGDGASKPLGVFTASSDGISTGRDVSTGNTTTAIKPDNLIEVQHTLKGAYWNAAQWIFNRTVIKDIRKFKDGNGQYMWQPGIQAGVPGSILNMPYNSSEYAPNTMTNGLYVGILGDFSFYWIADSLAMTLQRLDELHAETNETGFISRLESDGMPVLEEAFVRCILA